MKTLYNFMKSIKLTLILLLIFALSQAIGTFIENDYGIETSWALIYRTTWFEIVQILLAINLFINTINFKMYTLKKLPILTFHLSFIIILIASGITRYAGFEGKMNIKEGYTENRMLSAESFLQTKIRKNNKEYYDENIIYLSKLGKNSFSYDLDIEDKTLNVRYVKKIENVRETLVSDAKGLNAINIKVATIFGVEDYILEDRSTLDTGLIKVYFNEKNIDKTKPYMHIYSQNEKFYFISNVDMNYLKMINKEKGFYKRDLEHEFNLKHLYTANNFSLVPTQALLKAKVKLVKNKNLTQENGVKLSALIVNVSYDGITKQIALMGQGKGFKGYSKNIQIKDLNVNVEWGSKILTLPFSLHLKDFIVKHYAGSQSASSFESKVILIDKRVNLEEERRIYMNNTLIYDGYTFYQSSFNADKKGTILSVNNDPGKYPTYIGYFLLFAGLLLNLINPNSRFMKLAKTKYISSSKISAAFLMLFLSTLLTSDLNAALKSDYPEHSRKYINNLAYEDVLKHVKKIDIEHAYNFSKILAQNNEGRIEPLDTIAVNYVNKMFGRTSIYGLNYNQIFLSMVVRPKYWQRVDIFNVKHKKIKTLLGITKNRFSYIDVFTKEGQYKFKDSMTTTLQTSPASRGTFEKELIKIDERLNVAYMTFDSQFFKVFPKIQGNDKKWYTVKDAYEVFNFQAKNELTAILQKNVQGIKEGFKYGNWDKANEAVSDIIKYQKLHSKAIMPNKNLVSLEIIYNRAGLFEKLYPVYLIFGLILLVLVFIELLSENKNFIKTKKAFLIVFILAFLAHTGNLALRWYISGHAPWSNSYEAMLYISWTIILSGIIFSKQSNFSLACTGIFSGITLFVAHLSWLDPQITNLVPVLQSYWLTIHVSIITSSYGFLGLSALLGALTLVLYIILGLSKLELRKERAVTNIKELVRINELSLTIGITFLIIGNFLGGIWANESWGRYWGWDPKETWTLITIVIYALVLHIRYIPKLNSTYVFAVLSLVSYASVIMTYFGVNYYLSGLHSYASGEKIPVPSWVFYSILLVAILIITSFKYRNKILEYKTIKG